MHVGIGGGACANEKRLNRYDVNVKYYTVQPNSLNRANNGMAKSKDPLLSNLKDFTQYERRT